MEPKPKRYFGIQMAAIVFCCAIGFLACQSSSDSYLAPQKMAAKFDINGTWINKKMGFSVTIDTQNGTYNGTAMGEKFHRTLLVKEVENNIVVMEVNKMKIVAQFDSSDEMTITKEDTGFPVVVQRLKM